MELSQGGHNQETVKDRLQLRNYHRKATITELSKKDYNHGAITEKPQSWSYQ